MVLVGMPGGEVDAAVARLVASSQGRPWPGDRDCRRAAVMAASGIEALAESDSEQIRLAAVKAGHDDDLPALSAGWLPPASRRAGSRPAGVKDTGVTCPTWT